MKLKSLLGILLLLRISAIDAKPVDPETARRIAERFLSHNMRLTVSMPQIQLVHTFRSAAKGKTRAASTAYIYVFNADTLGFVMVSADDAVIPILGYSDRRPFRPERIPEPAMKFIEGYKSQIRHVIDTKMEPTPEITDTWRQWKQGDFDVLNQTGGTDVVNPLIKTTWDQSPYYNALCPFDRDKNKNAVTGCVATSMAQIMKYWNHPTKGSGFSSYTHPQFGNLSANYGSTTYNWSAMPNAIYGNNQAIATLMYHCGVSVEMNYSVETSGASPSKIGEALKKYFGYANTTRMALRVEGYTDAEWTNLMKTELNAGRPINYFGFGGGGGHSFICDGFDANNLFHMNWGWGGDSDGYFRLTALNPGGIGTGGGTGGYNTNQGAIIGIAPVNPPAQTINMTIHAALTVTPDPIPYGNSFTVTTNIANLGTGNFSGDYAVAIFDDTLNFVDFMEIKTGNSLSAGMTYQSNMSFTKAGGFSLLPGTYHVGLFYRVTNGQWVSAANSTSITNLKQVKIVNNNPIRLYSKMLVTPTSPVKGQSVSVNFNIHNTGTTTFTGNYSAGLYKLDGSLGQAVGVYSESAGLPANYVYQAPFLTLTNNAVTVEPGTYLMAIQHKSNSSNAWELTGTGNFQNPIKVVVRQAPMMADAYEPNNLMAQAYAFVPIYVADSAIVNTDGSGCHIVEDYDHYRINLPAGYNYNIRPRLHDAYNTGNGKTYTLDALFSYSTDGTTWSDAYDDVVPAAINVAGGRTLYIKVAPYFAGETGTYHLEIKMKRTVVTAVNDPDARKEVRIYPNPVASMLRVDLNDAVVSRGWRYELTDISGRVLDRGSIHSRSAEIPMQGYPRGTYLVKVYREAVLVRTEHVVHD
jgi:hypothetical protein